MRELAVTAVIPAYNAEATLGALINDVLEQEYDDVYVLDDASTDHTLDIAYAHSKDVIVVEGKVNLGSGGNRNRIIPELGSSAIIHFLDSDIRLNSKETPDKARELGSIANLGFVSGLVRLADGTQNPWNYGPAFSLPQIVSSWAHSAIYKLGQSRPDNARAIRQRLGDRPLLGQWPNTLEPPVAKDVFWGSEANMVIPSEIFTRVGGYNPRLRYHEVMELAMRLDELGLRRRFDPILDVTHESFDLMNNGTSRDFYDAEMKIIGQMGLKNFLVPPRKRA